MGVLVALESISTPARFVMAPSIRLRDAGNAVGDGAPPQLPARLLLTVDRPRFFVKRSSPSFANRARCVFQHDYEICPTTSSSSERDLWGKMLRTGQCKAG